MEHCNGCDETTEDAFSYGHLVRSVWDLHLSLCLDHFLLTLSCFQTLNFKHPSVPLFCLRIINQIIHNRGGLNPKSVLNRCVIEGVGGLCGCSMAFFIFCWYRGFCHRTESDFFLFLCVQTPSFEQVSCFIYSRRRQDVTRHWMICLVLRTCIH